MELTSNEKKIAMQANSVDELIELANGYEHPISREEAEEVFAQLSKEGELADDELEDVAGGACYSKDPHGKLIVTIGNSCRLFLPYGDKKGGKTCLNCFHMEKESKSFTMYCSKRTKYKDEVAGRATITGPSDDYGPSGPVIQPMK